MLRQRLPIVFFVLLLLVVDAPNLVWLVREPGPVSAVGGGVIPALGLALLCALCGRRLWVAALLLAPLAALAPLETYYVWIYGHPSSVEVLASLFASNTAEAIGYAGSAFYGLLVALAVSSWFAVWSVCAVARSRLGWFHRSRGLFLLGLFGLTLVAFGGAMWTRAGSWAERWNAAESLQDSVDQALQTGYPTGEVWRIGVYARQREALRASVAQLANFRFGARRTDTGRRVYVLVIGESSRRDHWQLFGYDRPTTPKLSAMSDLVPMRDFVSNWSVSIRAIPMILTRKPATDDTLSWKEASILRAMHEAGFETFWISNQLPMGKFDSPVSVYAMEADHTLFLNHATLRSGGYLDEDTVQPLADALARTRGDVFVVIHTMGSHSFYDFRYPPAYKHFVPVMADENTSVPMVERRVNSYDNTILYTDHVLAQIIDVLRHVGGVSALWYQSDHGEDLATAKCDWREHGNQTPHDFEIPALFWASPGYRSTYPERMEQIRRHASERLSSENTFESLLGMTGVRIPGQRPAYDVFSPGWRPHARPVTAISTTDFDKAPHSPRCDMLLPMTEEGRKAAEGSWLLKTLHSSR